MSSVTEFARNLRWLPGLLVLVLALALGCGAAATATPRPAAPPATSAPAATASPTLAPAATAKPILAPTLAPTPVPSAAATPASAKTDVVIDWNITALALSDPPAELGRPSQMRQLAMVHTAMHDAINAILGKYEVYAVKAPALPGASPEAAAASAAYAVLIRLFPSAEAKATLDARLAASLAGIPDGASKTDGITVGEFVGKGIFDLRASDGFNAPGSYVFQTAPGAFQTPPQLSPNTPPYRPQMCCVTPFVLKSPSQFRNPGPPALNSAAWARDYNELRSLGAANSTVRTAEQTAIAHFWIEGSIVTWNRIARIVAADKGNSMAENARLFALLNLSLVDGFVASWDTKFHYNFWRPVTAIRAGDTDGNPNTDADSSWTPLVATPNHPDYNSGHAVFCGAGAEVLKGFFGTDNVKFSFRTASSKDPEGQTRSYQTFTEAAKQCGDSRVWNGFHSRSAVVDGLEQGRQTGLYVFNQALRTR
jgi:hypothetical protein